MPDTCRQGHALTEDNIRIEAGKQRCRTCANEASRRSRRCKRDYLDEIKREIGCVECGVTEGRLHFDHRDDSEKLYILGNLNWPWDAVDAEIEKCDVRCIYCHMARHAPERVAWELRGPLDCWIWIGHTQRGVPVLRTPSGMTTARRAYYERYHGPDSVPEGMVLGNVCGEALCIRVHHSEPMTWSEWALRNGRTKMTPVLIAGMNRLLQQGKSQREIGRLLGVDEGTIRRARARQKEGTIPR